MNWIGLEIDLGMWQSTTYRCRYTWYLPRKYLSLSLTWAVWNFHGTQLYLLENIYVISYWQQSLLRSTLYLYNIHSNHNIIRNAILERKSQYHFLKGKKCNFIFNKLVICFLQRLFSLAVCFIKILLACFDLFLFLFCSLFSILCFFL